MRDSAGKKSKLFEGLGLAALGFVALALGDVAENQNNAGDFILGVANRRSDLLNHALDSIA